MKYITLSTKFELIYKNQKLNKAKINHFFQQLLKTNLTDVNTIFQQKDTRVNLLLKDPVKVSTSDLFYQNIMPQYIPASQNTTINIDNKSTHYLDVITLLMNFKMSSTGNLIRPASELDPLYISFSWERGLLRQSHCLPSHRMSLSRCRDEAGGWRAVSPRDLLLGSG